VPALYALSTPLQPAVAAHVSSLRNVSITRPFSDSTTLNNHAQLQITSIFVDGQN